MRFEMMFACFFISIIPIVIMQTMFYNFSRYFLEQKITTLMNSNMSHAANNIESDIEYYKEILYRIDTDDNLAKLEETFNKGDETVKEATGINLRDALVSYADIRDEISGVIYVNKSQDSVFYDKNSMSATNYLWNTFSPQEKKIVYSKVHNLDSVSILNTRHLYYNNENYYLYYVGMRVWNVRTGEDLGIVLLCINENHLQDICNLNKAKETDEAVKDFSFVIDADGNIVSFSNKVYLGYHLKQNKDSYDVEKIAKAIPLNQDNGVNINSMKIEGTNWSIVNLVDKDSMFHETNMLWQLTMGFTLLIIVICISFIVLFSNRFYKSIKEIVVEINKAKKGDFSAHIRLKRESELVFIGNEFNEMVIKLHCLVEDLKKQNEYIYEISNKRREAEINAIVAQINPHFLYNTLDCINWMLIKAENYDASRMIGSLADILRYSLPKIDDQVTIYDVIEWLKKYLYLHEVRFNNSFRTEYQIDEAYLSCKIYKLLLQPIVENAVLHGFKGFQSGRLLIIKVNCYEENALKIEISDNGNGISPEKLEHIFDESCGGIGINNVRERLTIYYGASSSMAIESKVNGGTRVTVIIPQIF